MDLLVLSVWMCMAVVTAGVLALNEGDICKQERGSQWICKRLGECPKAVEDIKNRQIIPQNCTFVGSQPVVCCEPQVRPPGEKSKEMCRKYAEAVFINMPDHLGEAFRQYGNCPVITALIADGTNAMPREFPHMALIGYEKVIANKKSTDWSCGGSLISERFILSAAHCAIAGNNGPPAKYVRLGDYNINSDTDDTNLSAKPTQYQIRKQILHPNYTGSYNDIALFELESAVEFNEFIRPLCLQTEHQFHKTEAIATGWGSGGFAKVQSIPLLQKVNLKIISREVCGNAFPKSTNLQDGIKDDSMLCAGENGKDTCPGDSGGPLQISINDTHYCMHRQVGITSFGAGQCGFDTPAVFTRVSHFVPWIESVVWP